MSVKYQIDGRDPDAKGYIKINALAENPERRGVVDAMVKFGIANAEDYLVYYFGRLDDVYGWFLFGVGDKYIVLDDCLEPLEKPYNKMLTLMELTDFATNYGSGENVGTAYEAMKEWGVPFWNFDGKVWVLTMKKDGQVFPEVHKTFEGCVDSVIADIMDGVEQGDEKEYDFDKIRRELREQMYWQDDHTDWEYDITECPLCNR